MEPMPAVATIFVSIGFKIAKQLRPILLVKCVERSPPRALNTEPDAILIHHGSHTREWQAMKTQSLSMMRRHHVNRVRRVSHNLIRAVAQRRLIHRRKPSQTLAPKMRSLKSRTRCNFRPIVANLKQFDPLTE